MIAPDMYPTTESREGFSVTNEIGSYLTDPNLGKPYYMGYIPNDDVFSFLVPYKLTIDDDTVKLSRANAKQNVAWGYCGSKSQNVMPAVMYQKNADTGNWTRIARYGRDESAAYCFINNGYMINATDSSSIQISYLTFKVDQTGTVSDVLETTSTFDIRNLNAIFKNKGNITLKIAGNNEIDFSIASETDNKMLVHDGDGYTYYAITGGFRQSVIQRFFNFYANNFRYGKFFKINFDDTEHLIFTTTYNDRNSVPTFALTNTFAIPDWYYHSIYKYNLKYFFGVGDVEFLRTDLTSIPANGYKFLNNFLVSKSNSGWYNFYVSYGWLDSYRYLLLTNKFQYDSGNTWGAIVNNQTYGKFEDVYLAVSLFNKDNAPTFDYATDNYADVYPLLQSWQRLNVDISTNDFNIDTDLPEYIDPDSPDDPDSDTSVKPPLTEGDTIPLQTGRRLTTGNDFVTLYNVTAEQLQAFGRVLYKSFADYDPAHIDPATGAIADNFYIKLADEVTGTLDISAVVNFIVSVRQYPFSVATLVDTSVAGTSNIYIGSGKVGIPVGSAVRLLTTSISVVDAGSCVVEPATPYNDFRDYYNTTVTCFLPYCGTVELNPIEVMHNLLRCYYAIDFYTGECTAFVTVDNGTHQYLCATKSGIIGVLIPITATNSGQLSARHTADNARDSSLVLSAITSMFNGVSGAATGNLGAIGQSIMSLWDVGNQQQLLAAERQGRSAVLAPSLSGGSGGASFMLPDSAYVQIRRGTYARPSNYGSTCAYPSTVSRRLSSFTGFTQCQNVNTNGITATASEKKLIYDLLQNGVYV